MILDEYLQILNAYSSQEEAETDLDTLIFKGFPLAKIFLLGRRDLEVQSKNSLFLRKLIVQEKIGTVTGTTTGLTKGFFWGNLTGGTIGVLLGLGLVCLPGFGQMTLASAMIFTLMSGGISTATGGVVGSLIGLGLSESKIREFNHLISEGEFLLVIQGTKEEISCAQDILRMQKRQKSF